MFTRRQAIRWAELWLSCWNEGDFDTLVALYRDTTRFGNGRSNGKSARDHQCGANEGEGGGATPVEPEQHRDGDGEVKR